MSTQSTNIDVRIARARAAAAKEMNEALREAFLKAMRVAKEAAEASPQLREDADRLREALRVLTWKYARTSRVSGATPEAMLVQLKRVLNAESVAADRRVGARLAEDMIGWSIEAYYSPPAPPLPPAA